MKLTKHVVVALVATLMLVAAPPASAAPPTTSTSTVTTTSLTTTTSLPPPIVDPLPPIPPGNVTVDLETVATGLVSPLGLVDDGAGRFFVYDQAGTVKIIQNGQVLPTPFLDVSARLVTLGVGGPGSYDERGLLGFALSPDFATSGKVYTYTSEPVAGPADFTTPVPVPGAMDHQSVIAEWTVDGGNPNVIDPLTRRELLRIDKPQFNHNAGTLRFGPDGYLYFTLGDGGNGDDEGDGHIPGTGNAQDTGNIYGKVSRIDPGGNNSANGQYGIPADNPFVGGPGVDELWAYGLRNPYAFSFDQSTGQLFLGDAGQNEIEEVDIITKGDNYGWHLKEGSFFFVPNGAGPGYVAATPVAPIPPGLVDPIAEYDHGDGVVVVGGFVYRGGALPGLVGHYVTGDFTTDFGNPKGRLFFLDASTSFAEFTIGKPARPLGLFLKGFGQDATGEVYVLGSKDLGPFGSSGTVQRIVPLADNLLGYRAGVSKKATPPGTAIVPSGASIQDEFGTRSCGIKKEVGLYNPVDPSINGNPHFVSYQLSSCQPMALPTATFTDANFPLGGLQLTAIRPSVLLVPSGKAIPPTTPSALHADTNRYLCYKVKGPKLPPGATAIVTDELYTNITVTLRKVTQFCGPASKDGEEPGALQDALIQDRNHYVCYQAKLPKGVKNMKVDVRTNNTNFGANSLQSKSFRELCLPATKS